MAETKKTALTIRVKEEMKQNLYQAYRYLTTENPELNKLYENRVGKNGYSLNQFINDVLTCSLGLTQESEDSEAFVSQAITEGLTQTNEDIRTYQNIVELITKHSKKIAQ